MSSYCTHYKVEKLSLHSGLSSIKHEFFTRQQDRTKNIRLKTYS